MVTSLSTQVAAIGLKEELHTFHNEFFRSGLEAGRNSVIQGYKFGVTADAAKLRALVEVLLQHEVAVYVNGADDEGTDGDEYVVSISQAQYRTVKAIFDRHMKFEDSLFYDVSAGTLPLAFNIIHQSTGAVSLGERITSAPPHDVPSVAQSKYGYVIPSTDYYAPRMANALTTADLVLKASNIPLLAQTENGEQEFGRGAIFALAQNQAIDPDAIH